MSITLLSQIKPRKIIPKSPMTMNFFVIPQFLHNPAKINLKTITCQSKIISFLKL